LRDAGLDTIARLDSSEALAELLGRFVGALTANQAPLPDARYVAGASRREQAGALASLLERACAPR
jgi:hypothetical protein